MALLLFGTAQLLYVEYGPTIQSFPTHRTLHEKGFAVYPSTSPIPNVNFSCQSTDAFAAFNPVNFTVHVKMQYISSINQAYIIFVPTSFDTGIIATATELQSYLAIQSQAGNFLNLTKYINPIVNVNVTESFPQQDSYTLLAITVFTNGNYTYGMEPDTMFIIGPYSDYAQAELAAQISNSLANQGKSGNVTEALTWIIVSLTVATIGVELRRR